MVKLVGTLHDQIDQKSKLTEKIEKIILFTTNANICTLVQKRLKRVDGKSSILLFAVNVILNLSLLT